MKKSIEEMTKIELQEYAKRCRYVLAKNFHEMERLNEVIKSQLEEIKQLRKEKK